jgi:hypothetical protein
MIAVCLLSAPALGQEDTVPTFDNMNCRYATLHANDLGGVAVWASQLLASNGSEDGMLWQGGTNYDLRPILTDAILERRIFAYCSKHQDRTVADAFATILKEATTPSVPRGGLVFHLL